MHTEYVRACTCPDKTQSHTLRAQSCLHVHAHALTVSSSAAFAPSDSSFATVPARPFLLATCNAVCFSKPCQEARARSRQCPEYPPLPPPLDHPPLSLSGSAVLPRPHSLPAPLTVLLTPHTLSTAPRALPAGPGRRRAWSPPSAPPPLPRACCGTP